ncbi:hypothetical protein CLH39_11055 [Alcaligenes faecalis]|nr:hypothetical protein CLH39_11055 [Alcaligenes faecalis]
MPIAVCFSGLEVQTKWWKQSAIECRCFAKQENTALIKRAVLMALRVSVLGFRSSGKKRQARFNPIRKRGC